MDMSKIGLEILLDGCKKVELKKTNKGRFAICFKDEVICFGADVRSAMDEFHKVTGLRLTWFVNKAGLTEVARSALRRDGYLIMNP